MLIEEDKRRKTDWDWEEGVGELRSDLIQERSRTTQQSNVTGDDFLLQPELPAVGSYLRSASGHRAGPVVGLNRRSASIEAWKSDSDLCDPGRKSAAAISPAALPTVNSCLRRATVRFSLIFNMNHGLDHDKLNEIIYKASVAKLETSVSLYSDKLELKVHGFNDKLPDLLPKVSAATKSSPEDDRFLVISRKIWKEL
ncbi:unnamed protein product [Cuscuta campestris]|uniref:Peptidase M16 middle/third domain-containing protein n=1 Tax=Cuscuta campestris TaxID=132261 RepID=A0A484L304_9ASTE|nr:unnamed protein product [Cuscuta campestris]